MFKLLRKRYFRIIRWNKVSLFFYTEFGVNITKYMTLPSVAMFSDLTFYDEKYQIKMIKGPLEKFIRDAYFGGNVGAFTKWKEKFKKDFILIFQYPKAMLNKLPIGDPVFSTNTDLSYYFWLH